MKYAFETKKLSPTQQATQDKETQLIQGVFRIGDGAELLESWKKQLFEQPRYFSGRTEMDLAYAEGRRQFVRDIITALEKHPGGNK